MTAQRRRVRVTEANLRHNHLYVTGLRDFFPEDAVGGPRRKNGNGHGFELILDGLGETVTTDIGSDAKTKKPRNFLRCRREIGRFYKHHGVQPGAWVELEKLSERQYRLRPARRLRVAEFFAGIGLVRLAWKTRAGKFANDIDQDKEEMYRHNWPGDNHFIREDIHNLEPATIPDCELATASFPCNDLSIAGRWEN